MKRNVTQAQQSTTKRKLILIAFFGVILLLIPISIWYFFYRDTVEVTRLARDENNDHAFVVFDLKNLEARYRNVTYKYVLDSKSYSVHGGDSGYASLGPSATTTVTSAPWSTIPEWAKPGQSLFYALIRISIEENGKKVGYFQGEIFE